MARLAIADPPYLGRAARWYGDGSGVVAGKGKADYHDDAKRWDNPRTHRALVRSMVSNYDGWAVAMAPSSLPVYLDAVSKAIPPTDPRAGTRQPWRVMAWVRPNAPASASRLRGVWEPVLIVIPPGRRTYKADRHAIQARDDVLTANAPRGGFPGAKPPEWTRWVLDVLGYAPDTDTVADLFPGSGAVAYEVAQQVIV